MSEIDLEQASEKLKGLAPTKNWPVEAAEFYLQAFRLIAQLAEEVERLREPLWTCAECGFTYDKVHSDEHGHHRCPCCREWEDKQKIDRLTEALESIANGIDLLECTCPETARAALEKK